MFRGLHPSPFVTLSDASSWTALPTHMWSWPTLWTRLSLTCKVGDLAGPNVVVEICRFGRSDSISQGIQLIGLLNLTWSCMDLYDIYPIAFTSVLALICIQYTYIIWIISCLQAIRRSIDGQLLLIKLLGPSWWPQLVLNCYHGQQIPGLEIEIRDHLTELEGCWSLLEFQWSSHTEEQENTLPYIDIGEHRL